MKEKLLNPFLWIGLTLLIFGILIKQDIVTFDVLPILSAIFSWPLLILYGGSYFGYVLWFNWSGIRDKPWQHKIFSFGIIYVLVFFGLILISIQVIEPILALQHPENFAQRYEYETFGATLIIVALGLKALFFGTEFAVEYLLWKNC